MTNSFLFSCKNFCSPKKMFVVFCNVMCWHIKNNLLFTFIHIKYVAPNYKALFFSEWGNHIHWYMLEPILFFVIFTPYLLYDWGTHVLFDVRWGIGVNAKNKKSIIRENIIFNVYKKNMNGLTKNWPETRIVQWMSKLPYIQYS